MLMSTGLLRGIGLAALAVSLPVIQNCGPKPGSDDFKGRGAYLVHQDPGTATADFKDQVTGQGTMTADISRDGGTLTVRTPEGTIHDLVEVPGAGEGYYSGDGMYAFVTDIPDVDKDGTPDDTFLVFTGNNPQSPQTTEYSVAYQGTAATGETITRMKTSAHTATYTGSGTASLSGAIGNDYINKTGDTQVTVNFGTGAVTARLDDFVNTGGPLANDFAAVTLSGELDASAGDSPDIIFSNIKLLDGTGHEVADFGEGGSAIATLFGPNAGGVIGALSGASVLTTDGTKRVNILGTFHGSTTDNNGK